MSDTMRVVVAPEPGGPEALRIETRPIPTPGPGELLVRVHATSVNRPDVLQRQGRYPPPPGASDVLGLDVAGEVAAVGDGVEDWRPGDRVCAVVAGGGYAEYAIVPAPIALPVPEGLSLQEAAAIPEVFATAYDNLIVRGALAAGETALIHGGASGVGTAAIQLAVRAGARVIATAGSARKRAACERLGAVAAVDHHGDWVAAVREVCGDAGVDVVLDIVAAPYLGAHLSLLAMEGRLVVIGTQGGRHAEIDLWRVMARRLTVRGSTLRIRTVEQKAAVAAGMRRDVLPGFSDGTLRPVIDRVMPLEEVAAAHAVMEAGEHIGKIVLTV